MSLFLFRFWPVFIPLIIYWVWHLMQKRKAKKTGTQIPHFRDGPLFWVVIASLVVALLCFLVLGFSGEANKGQYVPPKLEGGKITPGHIEP